MSYLPIRIQEIQELVAAVYFLIFIYLFGHAGS